MQKDLADKVLHYTNEHERFKRIESFPFHKSFVPMKEYCYDDRELEREYFETDKFARVSIEYSRFECLKPRSTMWYEIGVAMGIPKAELDEIEQQYKHEGALFALLKMVNTFITSKARGGRLSML